MKKVLPFLTRDLQCQIPATLQTWLECPFSPKQKATSVTALIHSLSLLNITGSDRAWDPPKLAYVMLIPTKTEKQAVKIHHWLFAVVLMKKHCLGIVNTWIIQCRTLPSAPHISWETAPNSHVVPTDSPCFCHLHFLEGALSVGSPHLSVSP